MSASEDPDLSTVASVLDDEVARTILAATSVEPMSAKDLDGRVDASMPTIYRRLDELQAADLVAAQTRIDTDGDHYDVFSARFRRLVVELERGDYDVDLTLLEDPADRFTRLFEEIG